MSLSGGEYACTLTAGVSEMLRTSCTYEPPKAMHASARCVRSRRVPARGPDSTLVTSDNSPDTTVNEPADPP